MCSYISFNKFITFSLLTVDLDEWLSERLTIQEREKHIFDYLI